MRVLVFDSGSQSIKDFLKVMPDGASVTLFETLENLYLDLENNGLDAMVVADLDSAKEQITELTDKILSEFTAVKRFFLTSKLTPAQLKEHQNSNEGADGYFKIPLQCQFLVNVFSQFGLSNLVARKQEDAASLEMKEVLEDQGMDPNESIGDTELSQKIQHYFDTAFTNNEQFEVNMLEEQAEGIIMNDEKKEIEIDLNSQETQEIELGADNAPSVEIDLGESAPLEIDLSSDAGEINLENSAETKNNEIDLGESAGVEFDLSSDAGELSLENDAAPVMEIDLSSNAPAAEEINLAGDEAPNEELDFGVNLEQSESSFDATSGEALTLGNSSETPQAIDLGLSEDAKTKLAELDVYLNETADEVAAQPLEEDEINLPSSTPEFLQPESSVNEEKQPEELVSAPSYSEHQSIVENHTEELSRMAETFQNLREEREHLLAKVNELENKKDHSKQDTISLKAELEEKKIELTVLKRRYQEQLDEFHYKIKISEERKEIALEKQKQLIQEVENLNNKVRLDIKRIQSREKELEGQLELIKQDADVQIKNRDKKIIELKRKIDSLEFEMETITNQEEKHIQSRLELEEKLARVMKTLRAALNLLDETDNPEIEILKKDLDV